MPLLPGDVFAGYTVVRQLGTGGMGAVHLVRHPRLPRLEALKVLRPEYSSDGDFARRFLREAELVAGLEHRNIVPVLDRGEDEGRLWLTMRFVDGIDAEEAIAAAGGLLPAARAVRIVSEVAAALDWAHRSKLVHRDVKPANVLLGRTADDEPEQVFLTDFGIAKSLEAETRLTGTGMVVATFAYASPEQIESLPLDARSDGYSLGCVLYRLLTGSVPFPGDSVAAALHGHLALPPPRPTALVPWLPPGLDDVVARAMAKDPADRYPSCRALAADAVAALDSLPALPARPFRVGVTRPGATAPTSSVDSDLLSPADRNRLTGLLRRTRLAELPPSLPGADAGTGALGAGTGRRQVTLELTSRGRTHRVVADLSAARRPPELEDLVRTVEELAAAAPTPVPAPVTVLNLPRQAPVAAAPPPRSAAPPVPRTPAPVLPDRAGPPAPSRARSLPAHPPAPAAPGPPTPPPWLHPASPASPASPAQPRSGPAQPVEPPRREPAPAPSPAARRRGPLVLAVVAALVAAGLVTWLVLPDDDPGTGNGDEAGATDTAGATDAAGDGDPAQAALDALPVADALAEAAVVVPRVVDGETDLYAVDSGTGEVLVRLTDAPEDDLSPVVVPGRASVVYARAGSDREWRVVAADGTGDRPLFPNGVADCEQPGRPTFDPTDPRRLALVCGGPEAPSLRVLTLDGALVKVLHEGSPVVGDPAWSPEGNEVAFFTGGDPERDGGALQLVDVSTAAVRQLTSGADGEDADPSWSPDGRQLAWRRATTDGQRSIVIGSPDVVGDARIVTAGSFDQDPVWSPDGATIAFKSDLAGAAAPGDGDQLWLIAADGSDRRQLPAVEGVVVNAPAWADYG